MNYLNFSNETYNLGGLFKEVGIDEEQRIDAIIANFDYICPQRELDSDIGGRDSIYHQFTRFCSVKGLRFILLEVSEDILYTKSDKFQKVISWIQRETCYFFEFRSFCCQNFKEEQQIEKFKCFIIFYPDNTHIFNTSEYAYCEKNYNINKYNNKYLNIIDYVFYKIKENLL